MVEESIPDTTKQKIKRYSLRMQIIAALIIFISGTLVGFGLTALLFQKKQTRRPRPPRINADEIAKDISSKYNLSDEQTQQVKELFNKKLEDRKAVRDEWAKRMETEAQQLVADMNEILTPSQFEQWKNDFENRFRHHSKHSDTSHPQPKSKQAEND